MINTSGNPVGSGWRSRSGEGGGAGGRRTSVQGRRSGEILGITEEDEEEEEEVEEVETFGGKLGEGEFVEEEEEEEEEEEDENGAPPMTPPKAKGVAL